LKGSLLFTFTQTFRRSRRGAVFLFELQTVPMRESHFLSPPETILSIATAAIRTPDGLR
jgi:hypothetical protein